jgi:hypothetical protein
MVRIPLVWRSNRDKPTNPLDGGINAVLWVNGKEVCNSKAAYGGEGATGTTADGKVWETIRTTSYCWDPVHVFKGDKLFMQVHYDMGLHPA